MSHSEGWKISGWRCLCRTFLARVCILSHPRGVCVLGCFTLRLHDFLLTAAFTFSGYASCLCVRQTVDVSPSVHRLCAKLWPSHYICMMLWRQMREDHQPTFLLGFQLGSLPAAVWADCRLKSNKNRKCALEGFIDRRFAPTSTDMLRHNLPPVVKDSQRGRLSAPSPPAATGYEMLIKFL